MYVNTSFPHRSGLLYKREHVRIPIWSPFVDDGGLFRLAVTAPAVDLQKIINSVSRDYQDKLEIRRAFVRKTFVQAFATMVPNSCPNEEADPVGVDIEFRGDKQ